MRQEMTGWQWLQMDYSQMTCTLLQKYNDASTSLLNFHGPDALPDGQLFQGTEDDYFKIRTGGLSFLCIVGLTFNFF